MAGLLLAVCTATACSNSTNGNNEASAEDDIENRWAAIVEKASLQIPNPLNIDGLMNYLVFPFTFSATRKQFGCKRAESGN